MKNARLSGFSYCKTVFDNYLCWPPTKPGTLIQQNCPSVHLSDPNRYATRRCREDGLWETHHSYDIKASGWTNFTNCFPPDIQDIFIGGLNDDKNLTKYTVAERSRYIEITGYLISSITVIIAIYILCKFRTLQNIRNFIHKHVFYSVLLETTLHLIIFFDQYITRDSIGIKATSYRLKGIDNTPTICEGLYVMAEYSVSAVYSWIFIEGLHLNYLISNNALQPFNFRTYCLCGWTVPLLLTTVWATVVWVSYKKENVKVCWFGYNLQLSYWILQGPRASVILCNAIILVRVLNMVVKKLKEARTPHNLKIKKSVKAALFLLPILGLSNALSIFDISIYSNIYIFMAFCYTRQFLKSFQGFFLTLIYCVGNEEVRTIVLRRVKNLFAIDIDSIDWLAPIRWIRPRRQVLNPILATSPTHTISPIRNESSSSMLQANALNNPVRQTTASSAEIPLAILSYSKGLHQNSESVFFETSVTDIAFTRHVDSDVEDAR